MSKVQILNLKKVQDILKNVQLQDIVFWIGAGVDCGGITGLPLGMELTKFVLQKSCGEKNAKRILDIWKNRRDNLERIFGEKNAMAEIPRLETIIEAIRIYEKNQIKKFSFINGLKSFSSNIHGYNYLHYILAYCLHNGSNIVTTNYGDFIVRAYLDMYKDGKVHLKKEGVYTYCTDHNNAKIYHIHGISSDISTIGASLSNVKNKLPDNFKNKIAEWLEDKYIIFLGYGGVDNLDVNPLLYSLKGMGRGNAIYVKHSRSEENIEINNNECRLIGCFDNGIVCPCDTTNFLEFFSNGKTYSQSITKKQDWKKEFMKLGEEYNEKMQYACLLSISFYLGIPYCQIYDQNDWYNMCSSLKNISSWYKHYFIYRNAVIDMDKNVMRKEEKKLLTEFDTELMRSDINAANGRNDLCILKINIDEIYQNVKYLLKDGQIIQWNISTNINRLIMYICQSYKNILSEKQREKFWNDKRVAILKCKIILEKIIEVGYNTVLDVNQINTAYRSLAICYALLDENEKSAFENLNTAIFNYSDISSIDGIVGGYIYKIYVCIIYFINKKNTIYLKKAYKNLYAIKEYVHSIKMKKYYSVLQKLSNILLSFS